MLLRGYSTRSAQLGELRSEWAGGAAAGALSGRGGLGREQEVPMRGALRDPVVPTECPQEVADLIDACRQREQHLRPSAKEIVRCAPPPPAPPPPPPNAHTDMHAGNMPLRPSLLRQVRQIR